MKKFTMILACTLSFAGCVCAETASIKADNIKVYQPSNKTIYIPAVDVETEVEIGRTIVSKAKQIVYQAVTLEENVSFKVEPSFFSNSWTGEANINQGTLKLYVTTPEGSFYKDDTATFTFSAGVVKAEGGIFMPDDTSKPTVPWYFKNKVFYLGSNPVTVNKTTVISWGKDSFSKELIYGGMSQNTITISYREFNDDTARPAFTQELKYDLSQTDPIGFRGARFQVIKANNTGLVYKVIKPLD